MSVNIGWLFYRDYFEGLQDNDQPDFTHKSNRLAEQKVPQNKPLLRLGTEHIHAKTTYPGLLIGTGYQHMTGGDGEFKTGFYFDYTSGLPVIPGSSVKGLLRSVFPYHRETRDDHFIKPRLRYIRSLLPAHIEEPDDKKIEALTLEIFEGLCEVDKKPARLSAYERDIFHDAVISEFSQGKDLLATDFITPHRDALKDPTPLMLLKVAPGVIFRFQFSLHQSKVFPDLSAADKLAMFRQIILDQGAGAKTNVGYGQFDEVDEQKLNESQERAQLEVLRPVFENEVRELSSAHDEVLKALDFVKGKINEYEALISFENEMFFLLEVEGVKVYQEKEDVEEKIEEHVVKRAKKGRSINFDKPAVGVTVRLILKELDRDILRFNVYPIWKNQ